MLQHLKSLSVLIVLFLTLFISQSSYAQQSVPKGFNYQAIARDGDGAVYADQQLVVEITISYGSTGDNIAWQEAHTVQTNEFGLFTLVIGEGMNTFIGSISSFDLIPWSSEDYFVGVKVDFGNGQLDMGAAQLKSVPYAVIADSALNFPFPKVEELADVNLRNLRLNMALKWDGKQWVPGDTLLADYLFLTQDLMVGNKTYINSDLYVNDTITATTVDADKGDFDNLLVNQDAVIQNNLLVNNNTTIQNYLTANNDIIGNNDAYINDSVTATTVDADMGDFDNLLVNINTTIQNDLFVNNDATVQNYLIINDDVMANTDLYVDDTVTATTVDATQGDFDYLLTNFDATIQNNLTVNNSTTIQNDLIVNDNSYLNSDLYVSDTITATTIDATQGDFDYLLTNFDATIQNDLTVNNSTTIQNDLIVNDNSYLNSDLYVNDSITATTIDAGKGDFDNLLVNQDAQIQNNLTVTNNSYLQSDLYVTDSITATTVDAVLGDFDNLVINQDVSIQNDLTVNGFATVQRELSVAEDINGSSDLYISDSITASTVDAGKGDFDNLQVNQDATVQNNLYVTNQAFINGVLSLATGTSVNNISTSTTLGTGIGSDNTLVTQAAIKYYVGTTATTLSTNLTTNLTTTESSLLTLVNQNKTYAEEHLDVTHGTVVRNKAVIVDGNKDISGFNDVGIDGDLTIGGVLDLANGTTINNISTEVDLGGGSPSNNAVPTQRAVKKYVDDLTSASGTNYINKNGNTDLTGDWDIDGNDIIINNGDFVTTGSGDVYVADDFEVGGPNTNKFTIDGSNGNTYIAGTLEVNKVTDITDDLYVYGKFRVMDGSTERFKIDDGNGNTKVGGNLEVAGDFKVKSGGTNYFVVDKDNGNTDIRGNLRVNNGSTDRFFVDASNGNTTVYGTLTVIDDVTIANTKTLQFGTGNAISSFSTNTNLQISGSARDYAIPTQLAVKTYIDASVGGTAIWTESSSEANYAGNVGIGLSNPDCRLHVVGGSIWFDGNNGSTPTAANNLQSVRLMWIPAKAAFRAGEIAAAANKGFWNNSNIGSHSTAFGKDTKASGDYSFATGQVSEATANYSFAIGESTTASGLNSISMGKSSDASGDYSAAFGNSTEASGESSIAVGSSAKATDDFAASFGESTEANGAASFAAGSYSIADGDYSVAIGSYAKSNTDYSVAFGQLSEAKGTHSVAIGKSCEAGSSGNNFSVAMGELSIASGAHSVAIGKSNTAGTNFSVAMGESSATNGTHSVALGKSCTAGASGKNYSFAMGESSTASGSHSFAMGSNSVASGDYSVVIGTNSIADGLNSVAIGDSLLTFNRSNLFVIGKFNSDSTAAAFVVGNGSSGSRNDALVLYKDGDLRISGNFSQSSDIRLKQNIVPLENVLNNIMKINPVYFEYIDTEKHPKGKQLGVIAQEIQKYYPELVREDGNGYLTVAYSNLNTVLFQAIKEQQEIINSLEKKLESQEARISALEK